MTTISVVHRVVLLRAGRGQLRDKILEEKVLEMD